MKDEIKEILECLEKYGQLTPDVIDDLHYIRDYITNLQEEIRETNENAVERVKKDYKSRCEKAIEYIENKIEYLNEQKRLITNILTPQNGYLKTDIEIEISKYQELLNILKGE